MIISIFTTTYKNISNIKMSIIGMPISKLFIMYYKYIYIYTEYN